MHVAVVGAHRTYGLHAPHALEDTIHKYRMRGKHLIAQPQIVLCDLVFGTERGADCIDPALLCLTEWLDHTRSFLAFDGS
jgi:hypothetical protein